MGMAPDNTWLVAWDTDGQLHWSAGAGQSRTHEPATGFWWHFKSGLFSLLPVEIYL
ncbi:MAG: hypothetical protein K8I04_09760 [Gammaproteobacteria bacterium]|nr:hypothetical protein [Gammaproteobacteria bacterium]